MHKNLKRELLEQRCKSQLFLKFMTQYCSKNKITTLSEPLRNKVYKVCGMLISTSLGHLMKNRGTTSTMQLNVTQNTLP